MGQNLINLSTNNNTAILGNSVAVTELKQIIRQVAPTDVTVLITGESGVGKEVAAHEIHRSSKRAAAPFVTVNCGAIPEGIIESELFGHQKGSFTGAVGTRKGYFEMADGGTIFLDEIGEVPLATQVKFLRVIENGEYMKVGSSIPQKVDVRIIAATNKDLNQEVLAGQFREDLYYRLRSINIYITPLRERKEDIKVFFDYYVRQFTAKNSIQFKGIDDEAMELIINYSWPGNVRQLKNFIESIITLNPNKKIQAADVLKQLNLDHDISGLPAPVSYFKAHDEKELLFRALYELKTDIMDIKHKMEAIEKPRTISYVDGDFIIPGNRLNKITYDDFEQEFLTYYWHKFNGNIKRISEKLKISYRTLYRKYKTYGLKYGKA